MADIRQLEALTRVPDEKDSSPELSESFEIYLQQRRKKVQEEKAKLKLETESSNNVEEPVKSPQNDAVEQEPEEIESEEEIQEIFESPPKPIHKPVPVKMTPKPIAKRGESPQVIEIEDVDDSFLEMEKMCENTLHLNNVSELLTDLTSLDASAMAEELIKRKRSMLPDESRQSFLNDVEAPTFLANMSMFSPKNSPFRRTAHENRPSTIMEVTELSTTAKSGSSSYQTAPSTLFEKSECYQTANEETFASRSAKAKKRAQAFFDDSMDFTKDSLDTTRKATMPNITQMTQDSLESNGTVDSMVLEGDESLSFNMSVNNQMDDTLEAIERMLAQGAMMNSPYKAPLKTSNPATPVTTPKQQGKPSPTPWSISKNMLKSASTRGTPTNSPLMKFSPAVSKSPMSNFKLPKPLSSSKTPLGSFASTHSKKFQHIISPVARYINNTPELPLSATAHTQFGVGTARTQFNFRDSDAYAKENKNLTNFGLPMRVKTKTTNPVSEFKFFCKITY